MSLPPNTLRSTQERRKSATISFSPTTSHLTKTTLAWRKGAGCREQRQGKHSPHACFVPACSSMEKGALKRTLHPSHSFFTLLRTFIPRFCCCVALVPRNKGACGRRAARKFRHSDILRQADVEDGRAGSRGAARRALLGYRVEAARRARRDEGVGGMVEEIERR